LYFQSLVELGLSQYPPLDQGLAQGRIDRGSGFFRWLHDESTPVVLGNNIGFYENIFKP
jgi:hypothetical protein